MSHNRFVFPGLAELKQALRTLPAELTSDASHIVSSSATDAAAEVKANYARVSGELVDGVSVKQADGQFSAGAVVVSKAKHAWMYENGTQARHTSSGANRGVMPAAGPGRAFIPVMIRRRRQMYERLKGVLVKHGLLVTGDAR